MIKFSSIIEKFKYLKIYNTSLKKFEMAIILFKIVNKEKKP